MTATRTDAGPETAETDLEDAGSLLGRPLQPRGLLGGGDHALTQLAGDGAAEVVVRSFPPGDPAVEREVAVLPRLADLGAAVPSLLAHDTARTRPLIVTTRVAGTPPAPQASPTTMAGPLARMLARVHALDGHGLPEVPDVAPNLDDTESVLSHGDYWCGNALWSGVELVGLVDWSGARSAPRGHDLSWCRLDLVLLGDPGAADVLVAAYERHTGSRVADLAAWDRYAAGRARDAVESWATNYAGIGRRHLTAARLRQRFDAWASRLDRTA